MNKTLFQLTRCVFEISPDLYMSYITPEHQEVLDGLYYRTQTAHQTGKGTR